MVCKIMCGNLKPRRCAAFSLVELLVSIGVGAIILTAVLSFTVYAGRSFAAMQNYVDLEQKSQGAVDSMLRDIRQTKYLTSFGTTMFQGKNITNSLTFLDSDNQPLSFTFTNRLLLRTKGTSSTMLLTNVDFLTFQVFKRNPVATTFEQFPTATATNCKLVSVSWICSRTILGSAVNTESVQTAKIVIRKQ